MSFPRLRLPVVLAVSVIVVALLVGAQELLFAQRVGSPVDEVLAGMVEVEAYRLDDRGGRLLVTVELARVENLQAAHQRVVTGLESRLGRPVALTINDRRHAGLETLWYALHHQLMDAEAVGGYAALAAELRDLEAAGTVARARLYVDRERAYLQLADAEGYLYAIVPRREKVDPS